MKYNSLFIAMIKKKYLIVTNSLVSIYFINIETEISKIINLKYD